MFVDSSTTDPGGDLSVNPVLVLLIFVVNKRWQDRNKRGEVEEGGGSSEPELLNYWMNIFCDKKYFQICK